MVDLKEQADLAEIQEEEEKAPDYKELLERFERKVHSIPEDSVMAVMYWRRLKAIQGARQNFDHQMRQINQKDSKVFWASLPQEIQAAILPLENDEMRKIYDREEAKHECRIKKELKGSVWYNTVALPAAEHYGLGPLVACQILWCIGDVRRFASFGKLVKYAGLDVRPNGEAPRRKKGAKTGYCAQLHTALYLLAEQWNRNKDCTWRARIDAWKFFYSEKHPEWKKSRVQLAAFRKVEREFLRNLYILWNQMEG
jgi:hypothetical protein